jgi:transcriptional regulator with XRE-family HTH domain
MAGTKQPTKRRTFTQARLDGRAHARSTAAGLGAQVKAARLRRRVTQADLARRIGISQSRESDLERGKGAGVAPEIWFALGKALGLPLIFKFGRDAMEDVADAGHLAIQELVLRLGRVAGFLRQFELPIGPTDTSLVIDVCLRDDRRRILIIVECWNRFGGIGASVRNTRRKLAKLQEMAVAMGGARGPYLVAACWVVRDTARNRELLARYPETFAASFSGSSAAWVKALTETGSAVPTDLGLVLSNTDATRIVAWHRSLGGPSR